MKFFARLAITLATLALGGCLFGQDAPPDEPVTIINAEIIATDLTNPDGEGRPSPIVVRIYELKSLEAFNAASFFALYDNESEILADDLVHRSEFSVLPGNAVPYTRKPPDETLYLAVIAGYRDIDQATWKAAVPIPAGRVTNLTIQLERLSVSIRAK